MAAVVRPFDSGSGETHHRRTPMLIPNFVTLALYLIGCNGGW